MSAASPFDREGARERQRRETRARLYDAALAAFARVGFSRASVADIARRAGVSRPSFYAHFPTKEHVLRELQWHKEREVCERLTGCATLTDVLVALPDVLVDAIDGAPGPGVARDMIRIHTASDPDPELDAMPYPLVELLVERFREGAQSGELRAGMSPEAAAYLCLTGIFGYLVATQPSDDRRAGLRMLVSLYRADD